MPNLDIDELPEEMQRRLAVNNPAIAQLLAERDAREPRREGTPASRRYTLPRIREPSEGEWRAFDRAQARYLEAISTVNEAYHQRNAQLLVRSNETARKVVLLLAVLVLTILAIGALGGPAK